MTAANGVTNGSERAELVYQTGTGRLLLGTWTTERRWPPVSTWAIFMVFWTHFELDLHKLSPSLGDAVPPKDWNAGHCPARLFLVPYLSRSFLLVL